MLLLIHFLGMWLKGISVLNLVWNKWAKEFEVKCSSLGIFAELVYVLGRKLRASGTSEITQTCKELTGRWNTTRNKPQDHQHYGKSGPS